VVNITLFFQTGTALTEETEKEKLSNRLLVRSCIWNIQTEFLVRAEKTKDIRPPPLRPSILFTATAGMTLSPGDQKFTLGLRSRVLIKMLSVLRRCCAL